MLFLVKAVVLSLLLSDLSSGLSSTKRTLVLVKTNTKASISIDGIFCGDSGDPISVPPRETNLTIKAFGYHTKKIKVIPKAGQTTLVLTKLTKEPRKIIRGKVRRNKMPKKQIAAKKKRRRIQAQQRRRRAILRNQRVAKDDAGLFDEAEPVYRKTQPKVHTSATKGLRKNKNKQITHRKPARKSLQRVAHLGSSRKTRNIRARVANKRAMALKNKKAPKSQPSIYDDDQGMFAEVKPNYKWKRQTRGNDLANIPFEADQPSVEPFYHPTPDGYAPPPPGYLAKQAGFNNRYKATSSHYQKSAPSAGFYYGMPYGMPPPNYTNYYEQPIRYGVAPPPPPPPPPTPQYK